MSEARRLVTVADDFGLTEGVNEAVEQASQHGMLTSASLMVGAPAFEDAVTRAKRCPHLHVGLHLVVIEGIPVLPAEQLPNLVDDHGRFPSDQLRLGINYFFSPAARRQLAAEIRAQFATFAATGLRLDHANAHKHMQLHPTVGHMMIEIGREFGLQAVRVPQETARPGAWSDRLLQTWCGVFRRQAARARLLTNDHVLGLGATGHMTPDTTRALLKTLPPGLTEMYFHPATRRDAVLQTLMPEYEHLAEFRALMEVAAPAGVRLTSYSEEAGRSRKVLF